MRLVTRGDLDGLTCAVLICLKEKIDGILLIHPQDITDRRIEILSTDIIANLPYHPDCGMWFDHHQHTATVAAPVDFKGAFGQAPSAARLVYEYYDGDKKMSQFAELVHQTDRLDSANLTASDILHPKGYIKLGFTLDGRTGLGDFKDYFLSLVVLLGQETDIEDLLQHPEVSRRCGLIEAQNESFREALRSHSRIDGNVVITDFRDLETVPIGNRFLIYALYPEANVSIRLQWGPEKKFSMLTLGHSVLNRSCKTNVGELAARYGGGGHRGASSIPLMEDPEQQIQMILAELKAKG